MNGREPKPPIEVSTRVTPAFALVSIVTTITYMFAWGGSETLAVATAAGLTVLGVGWLTARWNMSGLHAAGPAQVTTHAGRITEVRLQFERRASQSTRDLVVAVRAGSREPAPTAHVSSLTRDPIEFVTRPRFMNRGRAGEIQVEVHSRFPMGLYVLRAKFRLPVELLVLPRVSRAPALKREIRRRLGQAPSLQRRNQDAGEFHALRDWREGEALRTVAWKPSARRGRLLSRELAGEDDPRLHLVLVASGVEGSNRQLSSYFERAVQVAASLVDELSRGARTRMTVASDSPVRLPSIAGRTERLAALTALAEVELGTGAFQVPSFGAKELPVFVVPRGWKGALPQGLLVEATGRGAQVRALEPRSQA